jgi:hypothetical protein
MMPPLVYRIAADVVVAAHVAYVAFVVLGLAAIWWGILRNRPWVRNFWFRIVHLTMIVIVVGEAWAGIVCPLTTWENALREKAGQTAYQGDFIATWLHELLFFEAPPWVFTILYTVFGLLVLGTLILAPPQRPGASRP